MPAATTAADAAPSPGRAGAGPIRTATTLFARRPAWAHPTRREASLDIDPSANGGGGGGKRGKASKAPKLSGQPSLFERDVGRVSGWVRRSMFGAGARRRELRARAVAFGVTDVCVGADGATLEVPDLPSAMTARWHSAGAPNTSGFHEDDAAAAASPQTLVVTSVSVELRVDKSSSPPQPRAAKAAHPAMSLQVELAPVHAVKAEASEIAWNALAARKAASAEAAIAAADADGAHASVPIARVDTAAPASGSDPLVVTRPVRAFVPFTPGATSGIAVRLRGAHLPPMLVATVTFVGHVTSASLTGHELDRTGSCVVPWVPLEQARPSDVAHVTAVAAARAAARDEICREEDQAAAEANATASGAAVAVDDDNDSDDDVAPEAVFVQVPGGDDES
uniref:Uncharacterized protein n=1 Tax=Neobodo designis TaxID=312471 RepID=A0A7S1M6B1_NEODS